MLKKTVPVFGEPRENNGNWYTHVENLNYRDLDALYKHEAARGSFVFPHPSTGKAHICLASYGNHTLTDVHRKYWWLREDIGVETFTDSTVLLKAANETLYASWIEPVDRDDDLSPFGDLI